MGIRKIVRTMGWMFHKTAVATMDELKRRAAMFKLGVQDIA